MNANALQDWALALFPLWVRALSTMSAIGGWGSLANHYRRTNSISGTTWWFRSGAIRRYMTANYGGCLIVTANDEGMGLSVLFPFRISHPPCSFASGLHGILFCKCSRCFLKFPS